MHCFLCVYTCHFKTQNKIVDKIKRFFGLTCPAYVPNFFLRPVASPARHLAATDTNITLASFPTTWKRKLLRVLRRVNSLIRLNFIYNDKKTRNKTKTAVNFALHHVNMYMCLFLPFLILLLIFAIVPVIVICFCFCNIMSLL